MADLFWSYWDASVRFALLSLALLLVLPILKRCISPRLLCWAWSILMLRLALPFALPFSGSIFNVSESLQPSTWTEALRGGVVDAGWGETILPTFRDQDAVVLANSIGLSWETVLVAVWVLGFIGFVMGLACNARRLKQFFDRAERQNHGRLYELFKDTRRRYGIHANVPLLISDDVKTPGIAGIFNPRVVIPRVCAEELSDAELRCVFLHELTHHRRGDLFVHHAMLAVCFLHWYNPLVWLVLKQFKVSMEQACDADVVDSECIETAQQYGFTLLQVLQRSRAICPSPAGALCLLGNRKSGALKERIHLIAQPARRNPLFGAVGLALFALSFVYAITGEKDVEQEAERLLRLTRFSAPIFQITHKPADLMPDAMMLSPVTWVQDVDVSEYRGQRVRIRIRYSMDEPSDESEFWVDVVNPKGDSVATGRSSAVERPGSGSRSMELRVNIPPNASELGYGLSAPGAKGVWIESIQFKTDGSPPGD